MPILVDGPLVHAELSPQGTLSRATGLSAFGIDKPRTAAVKNHPKCKREGHRWAYAKGAGTIQPTTQRCKRCSFRPPHTIDPDLAMPGRGEPAEGCGDFYTAFCSVEMNHTNKGRGKRGLNECATRNCRSCARCRNPRHNHDNPDAEAPREPVIRMSSAARDDEVLDPKYPDRGAWLSKVIRNNMARLEYARRVEMRRPIPYGNGRLDVDGHRMDLRSVRIYHMVVSPPRRDTCPSRSEHAEIQRRAVKVARERGVNDFMLVAHAFRHDGTDVTGPEAYNKLGLHFHALGVSRWVMLGPPKRAVRGRPPKAKNEGAVLHAFDGKHWGPLRSQRAPLEDWVSKVVWFATPHRGGVAVRNLDREKTYINTEPQFAGYIQKLIEYLFHHATFYNAHKHPEDDPYERGKFRWVRTPGRHATPSSMAYGGFRAQPKTPEEHHVWEEVQAVWGPQRPTCVVCGADMTKVFDDPDSHAARLALRISLAA